MNIRTDNAAITMAHGNQSHQKERNSPDPYVEGFIVPTTRSPDCSHNATSVSTTCHVTKDLADSLNAVARDADVYRSSLLILPAKRNTIPIVVRHRDENTPHGRRSYLGSKFNPRVANRGSVPLHRVAIAAREQARERVVPTNPRQGMPSRRLQFHRNC